MDNKIDETFQFLWDSKRNTSMLAVSMDTFDRGSRAPL